MMGAPAASSISIEGDQAAGQIYVPRAQKLLRRLLERTQLGGVHVASDFVRLDDAAYCYAIVANSVAKAVIVVEASRTQPQARLPLNEVPQVPDFYSGATLGGTIPVPPVTTPTTPRQLYSFWPTPDCARLFKLADGVQPSAKLVVEPADDFAGELSAPDNYFGGAFSQYVKLKPTMYSGLMRHVVQLLMGFGRQTGKSVYDAADPKIGTIRGRTTKQATAYQTKVQSNGLQILYDWRWYRTHGVIAGEDGRLWLVEIGSTRGAIAMPLPMNPTSQLEAFREKLDTMGDTAGAYAVDALGGFPTGESFPADNLDSWIRAGRVVQLATRDQMDAFYQHGAFSSVLGWAFNEGGTEAHNTCVSYDDDGFQTAYHFAMPITIGKITPPDPDAGAGELKAKFASFQSDKRYTALMWKIDRLSRTQVREFTERGGALSFIWEDLDALVLAPQANGSGNLSVQEQGRLYKKGRLAQYDLKFPSPELGYLVSWDMQPGLPNATFHGRCDTTVHVFFVGNELKYVRFFSDLQTMPWNKSENDSDGCEVMGVFTYTTESGTKALPTMVYSNDYDDRDELTSNRSIRVLTGIDMGYSSVTAADDITFPPNAHLSRSKRFRVCTDTQSWSGEGLSSVMVVPFYDRSAYYYARLNSTQTYSRSKSCSYKQVSDPWSCSTWRNFPGYTGDYVGDIGQGYWKRLAQHPSGCGPVTARTVRAPGASYGGGNCADFADQGPWCFTCDNADAMLYNIPAPPPPASSNTTENGKYTVTSYLVNDSGLTPLRIAEKAKTGLNYMNPWFIMSPDPDTFITQYAEETCNAFGDSSVMRYYDEPNGGVLTRGGPQPPGLDNNNTTFIGVV